MIIVVCPALLRILRSYTNENKVLNPEPTEIFYIDINTEIKPRLSK